VSWLELTYKSSLEEEIGCLGWLAGPEARMGGVGCEDGCALTTNCSSSSHIQGVNVLEMRRLSLDGTWGKSKQKKLL